MTPCRQGHKEQPELRQAFVIHSSEYMVVREKK